MAGYMNKPVIEAQAIKRSEVVLRELATFIDQVDHLEKAAIRITATEANDGGKGPAAVAWLLKFLGKDPVKLKAREREDAQWDVARFALDGGQGSLDYGSQANWGMGAFGLHYPETAADWMTTLNLLQFNCSEAVWAYLTRGEATFPALEGTVAIFNGESSPRYRGEDLASGFYYMAAQLLSRYGHRVKSCEGCPTIMLIGRKDQRFHSQSCQIGTFIRKKRVEEKAARLAHAQRRQKAKPIKGVRKSAKGKKLKQKKGGKHGQKR